MTSLKVFLMIAICFISIAQAQSPETLISLRTDGRILTVERKDYLVQLANQRTIKISDRLRIKLNSSELLAIVVPSAKTGGKYLIGLIVGSETLPQDYVVNETDFNELRKYSTNKIAGSVEKSYRDTRQALNSGDVQLGVIKLTQLRELLAAEKHEPLSDLYAGYLLAELKKASPTVTFDDDLNKYIESLVGKYRSQAERSLDPLISLNIKHHKLPWSTPFIITATNESFSISDLSGSSFTLEPRKPGVPGYFKTWHGRSLVIVAENPEAPFDPNKYKGGLIDYLSKENPSLDQRFIVRGFTTTPFEGPSEYQGVTSAIAALDAQVERTPELFSAPGPRLQTEWLANYQTNETARETITTLSEYQRELTETTLERAALLAFALEDYQRAAGFIDTGLEASPGNQRLLNARGLMQYQQSLYPQALASLRQATSSASIANSTFKAALISNQGLVQWDLGQTENAETSLTNSIALFRGDQSMQQANLLLTQADFFVDYGQTAKALKTSAEALKLAAMLGSDKQARIVKGRVHRLRAKVALFRGAIKEANEEIDKAIEIQRDEASVLELAQSKDVRGDIQELTEMQREALQTLQQAAALYKNTNYLKGQSENQWKRANVLLTLNEFDEAQRLIDDASVGFGQLNYRRGLGDCETLRGILILRRANHEYLKSFHQNMTLQEQQATTEAFVNQVRPAVENFERAIKIFQDIGYRRGVAYARDKLAINLVMLQQDPSAEVFDMALQNSKEAAQTFADINDKRGQAVALGNLGIIYRRYGYYQLAISNLEKALQVCKEIDFKLGIGRQIFNLGRTYYEVAFSEKGNPELAQQHLQQAKSYFLEAQKVLKETQGGHDELSLIDKYLEDISEILRD